MASLVQSFRDTTGARKAKRMTRQAGREATKVLDPDLVNPRVWNMFREAVEFKTNAINPFQTGMADIETATLNFYEGVLPLLRAPLPRVWEMVDGGLAEPIRATLSHNHPNIAGGEMNDTSTRAAASEFEARLQLKVRRPLTQWSEALETVRERFPELERLRTRLEHCSSKLQRQEKKAEKEQRKRMGVKRGARGLTVRGSTTKRNGGGIKGLMYRCTHPMADTGLGGGATESEYETREPVGGGGGTEGAPSRMSGATVAGGGGGGGGGGQYDEDVDDDVMAREFKREERDMKLKDRQRKLDVAREAFTAEEGLLYEQLSGLCRDSAWTKSYVAAALLMAKELYQETVFNLGDTLQPLPACKSLVGARGLGEEPAGPEETEAGPTYGGAEGYQVAPAVSGKLGSNMAYNASMPDFANRARARSVLDELRSAASRRQHAHRATASPLEMHAAVEPRGPGSSRRGPVSSLAPRAATPELYSARMPRGAAGGGGGTPRTTGQTTSMMAPATPGGVPTWTPP